MMTVQSCRNVYSNRATTTIHMPAHYSELFIFSVNCAQAFSLKLSWKTKIRLSSSSFISYELNCRTQNTSMLMLYGHMLRNIIQKLNWVQWHLLPCSGDMCRNRKYVHSRTGFYGGVGVGNVWVFLALMLLVLANINDVLSLTSSVLLASAFAAPKINRI